MMAVVGILFTEAVGAAPEVLPQKFNHMAVSQN